MSEEGNPPEGEVWKFHPRWEGLYEVSTHGGVRSVRTELVRQTDGAVSPLRPTALKGAVTRNGYRMVNLCVGPFHRSESVHRLVLETFVGPCPDGQQCRHLNGIRDDNRLVNLRWGTPKENAADRVLHGTAELCRPQVQSFPGIKNPKAQLTDELVMTIRAAYAAGMGVNALSRKYGTCKQNISKIVHREIWKHLP